MSIDLSVALLVLFSLVLIVFPIWQSLRRRSLEGLVSDQDERPLERATVTLIDLSTGKVLLCQTDEQGRFHFDDLRAMTDYEIAVEHREHLTAPIALWKYSSHCELHLRFESVSLAEHQETPVMVLREGIADPQWFGVS